LCGDPNVIKKLSAPRLNLTTVRTDSHSDVEQQSVVTPPKDHALDAAWLTVARQIVANTTDVGMQFAEEARKIHYGESESRAIRGQTTATEARDLIEEGILVVPLMLPDSVKEPLQ
jgi:hypothetical protein